MRVKVRDVMTKHVVSVTPDTDFQTIARLLQRHRINQLPVLDEENRIAGVVSVSDVLTKVAHRRQPGWLDRRPREKQLKTAPVSVASQMMAREMATISPDAGVGQAAHDMSHAKVKALPVVDDSYRVVGIVSRSDLLKAFTRDDALIRQEIREDVLRHALAIDPDSIQVLVEAGDVTLQGSVESRGLIEIVTHLAAKVPGVVTVTTALDFTVDLSQPRTAGLPG